MAKFVQFYVLSILNLLLVATSYVQCQESDADVGELYDFCWFGPLLRHMNDVEENRENTYINNTEKMCICDILNDSHLSHMPTLNINCNNLNITHTTPHASLPMNTYSLDMSWNRFVYAPKLESYSLKILTLSHNQIEAIDDYNFYALPVLMELYLDNNKIEIVSMDAFEILGKLEVLDLSNNKIKHLYANIFSPLENLLSLMINRNPLNHTFIEENDDLYLMLGATPNLKVLELDNCNLNKLNIDRGVSLEVVKLRYNNFRETPKIPRLVQYLDLSGNPIDVINSTFLPHLYNLHTLVLEDMPLLSKVDEYTFYGMPKLRHINLQGNKNLSTFSGFAFGKNIAQGETESVLQILNLRGTNLNSLNESLQFVFFNLIELDLSGNPMICDCEIKWIRNLNIDTKAQCSRPLALKGKRLSQVPIGRLECSRWATWVYKLLNGLLVFFLLLICGFATWFLIIRLRPSRRNEQKVGSTSPYAPITIEPNRAEHY